MCYLRVCAPLYTPWFRVYLGVSKRVTFGHPFWVMYFSVHIRVSLLVLHFAHLRMRIFVFACVNVISHCIWCISGNVGIQLVYYLRYYSRRCRGAGSFWPSPRVTPFEWLCTTLYCNIVVYTVFIGVSQVVIYRFVHLRTHPDLGGFQGVHLAPCFGVWIWGCHFGVLFWVLFAIRTLHSGCKGAFQDPHLVIRDLVCVRHSPFHPLWQVDCVHSEASRVSKRGSILDTPFGGFLQKPPAGNPLIEHPSLYVNEIEWLVHHSA